jgi:hypothetical protein
MEDKTNKTSRISTAFHTIPKAQTSRRIFHRPMISQKRLSRASQTHILGPKKFL